MASSLSHPKYRPDIDGLRAVAVLGVVAYHAFPHWLKGGFIGVDIFFVISGYLISTILFQNLEQGHFSFGTFYARRVKRIFPALLLVLTSCCAFGWFALLTDEYRQLGKHVMASAGFVQNIVLWTESGYFDNDAQTKPLLHIWSLGVEEQFYFIWPLCLWACWKRKWNALAAIVGIAGLSFALNLFYVRRDPVAAFFLPQTRFWELLSGSLLAYFHLYRPGDSRRLNGNLVAAFGTGLLVAGFACVTDKKLFPGFWALLPVMGAVCVIGAGPQAWINRVVLSNRLAVWIGLISYPLYLWHWPLLFFGRLAHLQEKSGTIFGCAAIALSILLAWLTYYLIERPIRRGKGFVPVLLTANLVVLACGAAIFLNDGVADRDIIAKSGFSEKVRSQFSGPLWPYMSNDACLKGFPYPESGKLGWWFCMKSSPRPPTLILLGNSFANQLYPGFAANPALKNQTILSIGDCDYTGIDKTDNANNPCYGDKLKGQEDFIDHLIATNPSIRFAVLDGLNPAPDQEYIAKLRRRIAFLESKNVQVIIFTPHLTLGFDPKQCYAVPMRSTARDCSLPAGARQMAYDKFKPLIDDISRTHPHVKFFEQNDIYCPPGDHCSYLSNGMPLGRDEWHISEYASVQLQNYFTPWARANLPELLDTAHSP